MFYPKRIWRLILSRVFRFSIFISASIILFLFFCLYFLSCLQCFFTKFQFWIQLITGVIPSEFTFSLCFFAVSYFPLFFFLSSLVSSLFRIFVSRISCIFQFRINLSMRNIKMIIIIIFITLILLLKYIYFVKERIIFFILFPEYEYVILIYLNFWII